MGGAVAAPEEHSSSATQLVILACLAQPSQHPAPQDRASANWCYHWLAIVIVQLLPDGLYTEVLKTIQPKAAGYTFLQKVSRLSSLGTTLCYAANN